MAHASNAVCLAVLLTVLAGGCDRHADRPRVPQIPSRPAPSTESGGAQSSGSSGTDSGAAGSGDTAQAGSDDALITTLAKAALLADSQVRGSDIKVETKQGDVLLSGKVDSADQIARAASVVRGIDGVHGVENKITVK
jgi:hyperosmotically inducible protein